ncbi:MAG TPA: Gfo/Idh/MocA family oxidoreductase [Terriglobia bacterium]|nr:Gfo/Idh/MocA family oxidoreductase [Terriglobia bacterium]
MERREFIKEIAGTAAMVSAYPAARALGANDRVNIGWIGCGGRGHYDVNLLRQLPNVEIVAVCDVYEPHAGAARQQAGSRCALYSDFRKLLEQKNIDAVLIATPDHWHAATAVLACQAGKDVYVEKPLAHTIQEGRKIVDAARRHNRIVQLGTQHRSAPHFKEAAHIVQSGELGPVHFVRVWNYLNMYPDGMGRKADSAPPPGLNWDFYLGPAPKVPFNRNRFLVTYRWFWDYAGGMATDYGTHRFDSVHEVMGEDSPRSISASGGRYELKDGGNTPDTLQITYEYPSFILSYEASMTNDHGCGGRSPGMRNYLTRTKDDRPHGLAFYGTKGTLYADRVGFELYPEPKGESGPGAADAVKGDSEGFRMERKEVHGRDCTDLHIKNFIDCVRSRQRPVADVEIGHHSTIVPHLGNIALRSGHKIRWDGAREEIVDDSQASQLLSREARKPWDLI